MNRLVRALHGVGHQVEQGRGEDELQGVGEGAGGVHQHDVAGGQGGETLVVAVFVQPTYLRCDTI